MKTLTYFVLFLLTLCSSWQLSTNYFIILPNSNIAIHGSSNVNTFVCNCTQQFATLPYLLDPTSDQCYLKFHHTTLTLSTKSLDCGNKRMNTDMYETLKADKYPFIHIQLHNVNIPNYSNKEWENIQAKTTLQIAGTTKTVLLPVKMKILSETKVRLVSTQPIKMTDFHIAPPSAMLGMIRVNNDIEIEFDLIIQYG